jgi:hypothetical protein
MKGETPMRNLTTAVLLGSVLVAGVMVAPSLYAQSAGNEDGKDGGGMMGMMRMMRQMGQMMDHCNNMMSDSRPNEQWRKNSPSQLEKKG